METEDPLKDLADIHLPDPVSLWPPALGWWVLGALLALGLVVLGLRWLRRWQRLRRMRGALRALDQVYRDYNEPRGDEARASGLDANAAGLQFLHGCNEVLKRVALLHYPAIDVARLSGGAWLRFLDTHGATTAFSAGAGSVLGDGSYRRCFDADPAAVHALCARWVKRQYRGDKPTAAAAADGVPA